MTEYTVADLEWTSVREFRSVGPGKFYRTARGTVKEKLVDKVFVRTVAAGALELDEWYRLMEEAVRREGLEPLLDRLTEYLRNTMTAYYDPNNVRHNARHDALECLSSGAYKAWNDFEEGTKHDRKIGPDS